MSLCIAPARSFDLQTNARHIVWQKVGDFEEDFSSGYLFGELLWKFNQQSNFEEFSKK